ncbi:MAG: MYG1 family protein [Promethearchaeota archaeon]
MTIIITHPGSAHLDDFLSCCLVLQKYDDVKEIRRKEPTKSEINDPNIWVLDVGDKNKPSLRCYDHHQQEYTEDSTLSLLLKDWELWEKAKKVYKWLEIAVMQDALGSSAVAKTLKIKSSILGKLDSFIERSIIKFFQEEEVITIRSFLFPIMKEIGNEFFTSLREYFKLEKKIEKKIIFRKIKGVTIAMCFEGMEPSPHIERLLKEKKRKKYPNEKGGILIYPNRRIEDTIALKRLNDDARVDFTRVKDYNKVKFAHRQGFFLSLEPLSWEKLKKYLSDAIC